MFSERVDKDYGHFDPEVDGFVTHQINKSLHDKESFVIMSFAPADCRDNF